jgi:acetyl esterase/lipase
MNKYFYAALMTCLTLMTPITGAKDEAPQFTVEQNHIYAMRSGLALVMDVYRPEKSNGIGIIFISGSGWTRELSPDATPLTQTGQETIYAVPLAESGYTVFNLNHRAAPTYRYPAPVEDVQRAARYIRYNAADFGIDPNRIGAMGGSSGAHLVSMLGVLDGVGDADDPSPANRVSAKVQAVVTRAAPLDLRADPDAPLFGFRGNAGSEGSYEAHIMAEASPIVHVTGDDPPFLLIHGDADPVVPFEWSESMLAELQAKGVTSELIRVQNGGHGPRYEYVAVIDGVRVRKIPENVPDYIGAMIDWFDAHLLRES